MYTCYEAMRRQETEGRDYDIVTKPRGDTAILAIHGGGIEPGTYEIAVTIAGQAFGLYAFRGLKPTDNASLHIASTDYDEPRLEKLLHSARRVLSIHGWTAGGASILMGGRDHALRDSLSHALISAGFAVQKRSRQGLGGCHPKNVCNRGLTGKGVQMEISRDLRRQLCLSPTTRLMAFANAVHRGLGGYPHPLERANTMARTGAG